MKIRYWFSLACQIIIIRSYFHIQTRSGSLIFCERFFLHENYRRAYFLRLNSWLAHFPCELLPYRKNASLKKNMNLAESFLATHTLKMWTLRKRPRTLSIDTRSGQHGSFEQE